MLKLLKYEWKACARTCLPLYGVLILMSLISRILYIIPKTLCCPPSATCCIWA